jgi:hypothetical protein
MFVARYNHAGRHFSFKHEDQLSPTERMQQVLSSPNDGQQEHGNHNNDNDYKNRISTQHRAHRSPTHLAVTGRI